MKKTLLLLAFLFGLALPSRAQNTVVVGQGIMPSGSTLPTVCSPTNSADPDSQVFFYHTTTSGGSIGLYQCTAANTWSVAGGSSTLAIPATVSGATSGGIPCFTGSTTMASSAAIGAGILIAGGGAGACVAVSSITDNGSTISTTEPITGAANTTAAFRFANSANTGFGSFSANNITVSIAGAARFNWGTNTTDELEGSNVAIFDWGSGGCCGAADTGLSRKAADMVAVGNGNQGSIAGFIKAAQTLEVVTSDFTCTTGCTTLATITGLSVALPSVSANWSFSCDLVVSQATAAATNQIGVQTATNAPTNLEASAIAYTAAAVSTTGAIVGVASTSSQSVVTFTPGAAGTNMPIHLAGTVEGASASGTTLNIQVLTGSSSDAITIRRGSACWVY